MKKLCFNCMKEYDEQFEVCPHCGFIDGTPPKELYHLHPGEILHGRYIVGTVVDYGGFGVIYRVWDAQMNQMVAIKEYFPSGLVNRAPGQREVIVYSGKSRQVFEAGLERYLMEARNMAAFTHPNIVNLYDYFEENNTAYIVMEYLDGISLKTYLAQNGGKISYKKMLTLTMLILSALEEIHKHNIIHRDISPDNIFLCSNERVKLIDFGAARFSSTQKEETRSIVLKPGYAPPEQYRGKSLQGPFTDLYAMGACMYRAITGVMPEESLSRMMEDHLKEPKELTPDLPEDINNTIMKAMALSPEYRFQNVKEFEEALRGKKKVVTLQTEIRKRQGKRKKIFAAVIVSVFVCCAAVYYEILNHTRLIRISDYSGDVNFYIPESKENYFKKIEKDFEKDNPGENITLVSIADNEYKTKVLNRLGEKDGPALFFSDGMEEKELTSAENLEKYVVGKLENLEDDFYFLTEYYGTDKEYLRMPLNFSVPFIIRNTEAGKALKTAPGSVNEFQLKKKAKEKKASVYKINKDVMYQAEALKPSENQRVERAKGLNRIIKGKSGFYITDWTDYKEILTNHSYMNVEIVYPAKDVNMKVKFSNYISISDEVDIQAKMIAEDFAIYVINSQAAYLSDLEENVLPVNKKAVDTFSDIWTINLTSSLSENDGKTQFENYLETCIVTEEGE